ncbi:hydroxymethylbilane synthase [Ferruginibacter sp. HRS2-29]|uniref:hydroxymethylbilane synthase n=1 Tax=Ferruginibacter sp. HRS2-29 TaxID=2487334 RepID=UPI0020CD31EF|nr:hydroxymethylbilane synthase [Ferruginibacter sp. HRS2-29]MCP9749428.1 hydroxymethylbilane synthase [Ferruginibacter sp. HRS2-29]
MQSVIKIGTRESELAVWQATMVKEMLEAEGHAAELLYIRSEGDIDLKTPLYEMGVQGIFTRSLDIALLNHTIDIAVHSMKDVPTQLPQGICQAAVIKRGNYKDLFVPNPHSELSIVNSQSPQRSSDLENLPGSLKTPEVSLLTIDYSHIATSSIRRKAQWLHRYPQSIINNIRGNVNTRLQKLAESNWHGAIFAAAGLERINRRPHTAIELDWMLPAPAQGAVMVVARTGEDAPLFACAKLNDEATAVCTKIERDFLRELLGGCSTPISALAQVEEDEIHFEGNILSLDGKEKASVTQTVALKDADGFGKNMAIRLLQNGGAAIAEKIRDGK